MKKKGFKGFDADGYTDEPIGEIRIIEDFLPPPSELVLREETVKITLSLTKETLKFFKQVAKANKTPYQKMIRNLLDQYAQKHGSKKPRSNKKSD